MQLKAMLLLGINCGFGNADCGNAARCPPWIWTAADRLPRPKTGIPRRCPLWPETVEAHPGSKRHRAPGRRNPDDAGLVFITPMRRAAGTRTRSTNPSAGKRQITRGLGITARTGLGFYTLRHTFRTIADEAKDQPAADFIMGHEVQHMSSVYRETISDARLKAVTDYVRAWLFPPKTDKPEPKETGAAEGGE